MELQEFIKESLVQIATGITDANKELTLIGGCVNPSGLRPSVEGVNAYGSMNKENRYKSAVVEVVRFDVAVVAGTESGAEGGLRVGCANLGVGGELNQTNSETSESRLTFKIPMVYPTGEMN
jgi:hypothetical protein